MAADESTWDLSMLSIDRTDNDVGYEQRSCSDERAGLGVWHYIPLRRFSPRGPKKGSSGSRNAPQR